MPRVFALTTSSDNSRDVRQALIRRGWVENPDPSNDAWDLRWVIKTADIDHKSLRKDQIVNHFPHMMNPITTKAGLHRQLRLLRDYDDSDPNDFFPLCFDLSSADERTAFIEEYRMVAAESLLRGFVGWDGPDDDETETPGCALALRPMPPGAEGATREAVELARAQVALAICQQWLGLAGADLDSDPPAPLQLTDPHTACSLS
ncbi:putative tubulin-tyrosine ligase family protein [Paratrimastix pyriformis]|uniref:Tubulin-tyrosine ligase family protein n=1 Tax=Paratrimastix pyriformis TaxID=342808 RepID=A0ABQ8UK11_9EUKA|nr:putative tubulin-tyrosine ligase family protein [Paratrimastix pyriformis]